MPAVMFFGVIGLFVLAFVSCSPEIPNKSKEEKKAE